MIVIERIEIKNFRSIVSLDKGIKPNHLNIIVGKNDIGKSNFLKALNLFFNGETEIGTPFRFNDDFSKYAKTPIKKAREITIKIMFNNSRKYWKSENLIWEKRWRMGGLHKDSIKTRTGKTPSGRSGSLQWIKKLRFLYVPAIRGNQYFNYLMGELHDSLSEVNPKTFNDASDKFISGLKNQVLKLTNDISENLGYKSQIGLPSNFKLLFATLDFSLGKKNYEISLNKRGDGIKAQYIPVILKFIADHYKTVSGRGVIATDTIWGFEEPENNMEMANTFKLAQLFSKFSQDIQIFINTHSPAFYSIKNKKEKSTTLFLAKTNDNQELDDTKIIPIDKSDVRTLDREMGVLPIISSYIEREVEKSELSLKKVQDLETKLKNITIPVVITEGKTDVSILDKAWEILNPDRNIPFKLISVDNRTDNQGGTGGYPALNKFIESIRPDGKLHIALYDRDRPAIEKGYNKLSSNFSNKKIDNHLFKLHQNNKGVAILLPTPNDLLKFEETQNLCIEFYFDIPILKRKLEGKGLDIRKGTIIIKNSRGIELRTEEVDEEEEYQIKGGKDYFATKIVPSLDQNDFRRFKILFDLIEELVNRYS